MIPKRRGYSKVRKGPARNQEHMGRIAQLGCLICGDVAQAHHVDVVTMKNMGPKVSDYLTAPLCFRHHQGSTYDCAHGANGERAFWSYYRVDIREWINRTLREFYPVAGTNPGADEAINATGGRE
jgi:hypothetical protein